MLATHTASICFVYVMAVRAGDEISSRLDPDIVQRRVYNDVGMQCIQGYVSSFGGCFCCCCWGTRDRVTAVLLRGA